MLLQIFEDGYMTDGKGRKISFRNTIIILTSNVGAERFQSNANSIGFSATKEDVTQSLEEFDSMVTDVKKDLKKTFAPEFINRLDSVITFKPLAKEAIKKIVQLQIDEFQSRLKERKIHLKISGTVLNTLAEKSYHPESGARQVRRVIADMLENPLVEDLIHGFVSDDAILKVSFDEKKQVCIFKKID